MALHPLQKKLLIAILVPAFCSSWVWSYRVYEHWIWVFIWLSAFLLEKMSEFLRLATWWIPFALHPEEVMQLKTASIVT